MQTFYVTSNISNVGREDLARLTLIFGFVTQCEVLYVRDGDMGGLTEVRGILQS